MNNEELLQKADALKDQMVRDRRQLHEHPETGFDLEQTKPYVKKRLEEMGYDVQEVGKAGLIAEAGDASRGKTILLRADMDALPLEEEADVEYKSQIPGKMHGCGHDMHTAMLLAAAEILKEQEDQLPGRVRLVFQPAEEIFQGSKDMIENGELDGVDAAFMIHVTLGVPMPAGTVIVSSGGVSMTSCEQYEITVHGRGGHGSMPWASIDPLNTACLIQTALQEINSRELMANEYAVFTTCCIEAGHTSNVIPETAVMKGTIRTVSEDVSAQIRTRMEEIAKGVGSAYRCDVDVRFFDYCPPMLINEKVADTMLEAMKETFGDKALDGSVFGKGPGGGSEDFAFVSQKVPTSCAYVAAGNPEEGFLYSQHNPKCIFDERALPAGAAAYVSAALKYLEDQK